MIPLDIFNEHWTVSVLGRITFNEIEDWALEQGFVWVDTNGGPTDKHELTYLIRFNYRGPGRMNIANDREQAAATSKGCVETGGKVKMLTYHEWRDYVVPAVAKEKEIKKIREEVNA